MTTRSSVFSIFCCFFSDRYSEGISDLLDTGDVVSEVDKYCSFELLRLLYLDNLNRFRWGFQMLLTERRTAVDDDHRHRHLRHRTLPYVRRWIPLVR